MAIVRNFSQVTLEPTKSGVSVTTEGSLLADVFVKASSNSYVQPRFIEPTLGVTYNVTCPTVESPYSIWIQFGKHFHSFIHELSYFLNM